MTPVQKIKERYAFDKGWVTLSEVEPPLTGPRARRYDAISIAVWRSMGTQIHGFEVKKVRSDWLRELADPTKADTLMQHCSHWWLVCPKEVIANLDEVPDTWGVLFETDSGLRIGRKAQRLTNHPPSADFWRCMLLRQATRTTTPEEITAAVEKAKEQTTARLKADSLDAASRLRSLEDTLRKFEAETGIRINEFSCSREIARVKLARTLNLENIANGLARAENTVRETAQTLTRALESIGDSRKQLTEQTDAPSR
jgi:hypothetical protein